MGTSTDIGGGIPTRRILIAAQLCLDRVWSQGTGKAHGSAGEVLLRLRELPVEPLVFLTHTLQLGRVGHVVRSEATYHLYLLLDDLKEVFLSGACHSRRVRHRFVIVVVCPLRGSRGRGRRRSDDGDGDGIGGEIVAAWVGVGSGSVTRMNL